MENIDVVAFIQNNGTKSVFLRLKNKRLIAFFDYQPLNFCHPDVRRGTINHQLKKNMAFDIDMIKAHYAALPGKVEAARKELGRPLTLSEKILYYYFTQVVER